VPRDFVRKCKNAKKSQLEAQEWGYTHYPLFLGAVSNGAM
jgi:hypothetical protein